jgi:iron complex outermembrane receptor protein
VFGEEKMKNAFIRIATGSSFTLAMLLAGMSDHAIAQTASSTAEDTGGITDIVVTAQKRSESSQKTPLALTALSGSELADRGQVTVASIAQQVPNLNVSEQIGQARITLRGIGVDNISTGAESSIALNQDGVFYSRSAAALASFYDIERIEVLRGPQGTLYGRNATGGSVNFITAKPTFDLEGFVRLTGGNYSTYNSEAAISGPLSDTVAVRLAGQTQHHSGYGRNLVSGTKIDSRDSQAIRGQILFKPDEKLSVLLGADYYHQKDRSNGYHYFNPAVDDNGSPITPTGLALGGFAPSNPRDLASTTDPRTTAEFYGFRLDVNYAVSDSVSIRSLSAYRRSDYHLITDISPLGNTLFPLFLTEKSDQWSQEFQLNVESDVNKFVAGLYYLHEKIDGDLTAPFNLMAVGGPDLLMQGYFAGGRMKTKAAAIYGQDTYTVTDGLRLTVGARHSWERKTVHDQSDFDLARVYDPANVSLVPFHDDRKTFKSFTPKIGIDYDLAQDVLLYASYSKGFKAGTYNLGSATPPLNPEKVDAFEGGIKATLLNRRLRANIAGFYYNYKDLQVGKVKNTVLVLENAATATIYGLEGEFTVRPIEAPLTLTMNGSWLHARFDKYVTSDPTRPLGDGVTTDNGVPAFNLKGKHLPQAPSYVINVGAEYAIEAGFGTITLRGESTWSDRVYFSPFNLNSQSQSAYNL